MRRETLSEAARRVKVDAAHAHVGGRPALPRRLSEALGDAPQFGMARNP